MKLKPESARALVWSSAILILLGLCILSTAGAFALFLLAALLAAFPTALAGQRPRIFGAALLICALALAASDYPQFAHEQDAYTQRAKERAAQSPVPANQENNR